jgi:hypothetical protein
LQIQFLAARDDIEDLANELFVEFGLALQEREAGFAFFEQDAFGGQALLLGELAEIKRRGARAKNTFAERLQHFQPLLDADNFRVGNRVRGAREQIGEADLWANRFGEDVECEIKRA